MKTGGSKKMSSNAPLYLSGAAVAGIILLEVLKQHNNKSGDDSKYAPRGPQKVAGKDDPEPITARECKAVVDAEIQKNHDTGWIGRDPYTGTYDMSGCCPSPQVPGHVTYFQELCLEPVGHPEKGPMFGTYKIRLPLTYGPPHCCLGLTSKLNSEYFLPKSLQKPA